MIKEYKYCSIGFALLFTALMLIEIITINVDLPRWVLYIIGFTILIPTIYLDINVIILLNKDIKTKKR